MDRITGYEIAEMPFDDIVPRPVEQRPIVLLQKARQAQVKTVETPRTAKLDRNVLSFAGCGESDDDESDEESVGRKKSFSLKRKVLARPQVQSSEAAPKYVEPRQDTKQPAVEPSVPQQQQQQQQVSVSSQPEEVEKKSDDAQKGEKEPKRRKRSAEDEEKLLARMERFRRALRASMNDDKGKEAGEGSAAAAGNEWMNHTLVFKKVTAEEDEMVREDGGYICYDPRMHKSSEQSSRDTQEEKKSDHHSHSRSHHSRHGHHHHYRDSSHSRH